MSMLSSVLACGRRNRENDGVVSGVLSRMLGTLISSVKYRVGAIAGVFSVLTILFVIAPAAFGQSVATGLTHYTTDYGCSGCHITNAAIPPPAPSGSPSVNHLHAANHPAQIATGLATAGEMLGLFAPNPTAAEQFSLSLFIGQYTAPVFSGALPSIVTRTGVSDTVDVYPSIPSNGTSGVARDGSAVSAGLCTTATTTIGLSFSAPLNGGSPSVAQVGVSGTGMRYDVTYAPPAGFAGTDPFSVRVCNRTGTATGTVAVTVYGITSAGSISRATSANYAHSSFSFYQLTSNDGAVSLRTASALPAGLLFDSATGEIYGTPTAAPGLYNVTLGATINSAGSKNGTVTQNLAITLTPNPPAVSGLSVTTGNGGQAFSTQITTTGGIPASYALASGSLPAGLTLHTGTGIIDGTPTVNGVFNFNVTATNTSATSASTPVTITLTALTPVVTGLSVSTGSGGSAFSSQINATNIPTSYAISSGSLPSGLSLNPATGVISGTPTVNGVFNFSVTASNTLTSAPLPVTITLSASTPVVSGLSVTSGNGGNPFSSQIMASNVPTSYAISSGSLPTGLTLNPATGIISGTPTVNGVFNFSVTASNTLSSAPFPVTITLTALTPVVSGLSVTTGSGGSAFSSQINASNIPTSYAVSSGSLPGGLTLNPGTGVISGTPTVNGVFNFSVTASNTTTSAPLPVTITLTATLPVVTSGATASGAQGAAFSYTITALNVPTSFGETGALPPGVTLTPATGVISGTPTTGGVFNINVTATNGAGTSAPIAVTFTINFGAPVVAAKSVTVPASGGTPIDLTSSITGAVASIAVASPPTNGTFTVSGNIVTYTPNALGSYPGSDSFTYTATSPTPGAVTSAPATVTITINALGTSAAAVTMTVPLNTPTTLDLAPFVTGTIITGVNVTANAAHGAVAVAGTKVTYTPVHNYFGADTFSYQGFGAGGTSPAAVVTVTVTGRPDPTADANVVGLVDAQVSAGRRFTKAQIANFQQHMESLHRRPTAAAENDGAGSSGFSAPVVRAKVNSVNDDNVSSPLAAGMQVLTEMAKPEQTRNPAAPTTVAFNQVNGQQFGQQYGARQFGPQTANAADIGRSLLPAGTGIWGNTLLSALTNSSISLASLSASANAAPDADLTDGLSYWASGNVRFGSRNAGDAGFLDFRTDGVTLGIDRYLNPRLTVGMGIGYARDHSTLSSDGSNNTAKGASIAVYSSYQPTPKTYVDALAGYGLLKYKSNRFVASVNSFAEANRDGDQWFGSIAAGYEYRQNGFLLSPYGRLDVSLDHLDPATESGAGLNALHYSKQNSHSEQIAFGVRTEATHQSEIGVILPHARLEYQYGIESNGKTTIHYADQPNGTAYSLTAPSFNRNSLVFGVGSDFLLRGGVKLSFDYQTQRSIGQEDSQAFGIRFSKDLDGKATPIFSLTDLVPTKLGVSVTTAFNTDDNINRSIGGDKHPDSSFSLQINKRFVYPLGGNTRAVVNGFVNGEKFHTYTGMENVSAGVQGEYQYRSSGDFDAPTFGVFGRLSAERFQAELRDGYRYSVGMTVRQPLTDRIDIFGALSRNIRSGKNSNVFDTRDSSARINLDYKVNEDDTIYLTGEYRHGDVVSSGQPSLKNADTANALVRDDIFTAPQLFDYRFVGDTYLMTLGYSLPLGPTDGLDFSWRRVQSGPSSEPSYVIHKTRYFVNQFSFSYLLSF